MVTAVKADEISPAAGAGLILETGVIETGAAKENETGAAAGVEIAVAEISGIFCDCRLRLLIRGCAPMVRAFCSKLMDGVEGGVMSSIPVDAAVTAAAAAVAAVESGSFGAADCSNLERRLTRA